MEYNVKCPWWYDMNKEDIELIVDVYEKNLEDASKKELLQIGKEGFLLKVLCDFRELKEL